MKKLAIALTMLALWVCLSCPVLARYKAEFANNPPEVSAWYEHQKLTSGTQQAFKVTFESCCNNGDVCTDCIIHRYSDKPPWTDGWWYEKDGQLKQLPPHLVEYVDWTPTGKPVLFLYPYQGGIIPFATPVCLKVPGGGT